MIYTVDEVSDALDIPRPTLYRYLREYSIPHLRRSGKISIPEESFDRIREARELHKEGLGTESVRRRLREEETGFDPADLSERLDRISEGIDKLQTPRPVEEVSPSTEALRSIAKKQDLLISAVSDLAERMDDLLSTNARSRKVLARGDVEESSREEETILLDRPERSLEESHGEGRVSVRHLQAATMATAGIATGVSAGVPANGVAMNEPPNGAVEDVPTEDRTMQEPPEHPSFPARRETFGSLARRRRRGVMALLLALLLGLLALAFLVGWLGAGEEEEEEAAAAAEVQEIQEPGPDERGVQEDPPGVPEVENEGPLPLEVPYLVGLTLPEAEARLAEAGFEAGDFSEIATYVVPAGQVAAQAPPVGTQAEPGTPVNLVVSAGPPAEPTESPAGATGQYPVESALLPAGVAQYPGGDVGPGPLPPAIPAAVEAG